MSNSCNDNNFQNVIKKLLNKWDVPDLRAAVILYWAKKNNVSLKKISNSKVLQKFIDNSDKKNADEIQNKILSKFQLTSIKQIEGCFENFIEKQRRKSQGAVYTPNYIIDYLIKTGLTFIPSHQKKLPSICDPACGSAGFIVRMSKIIRDQYNISLEKAFAECLAGIDNDPSALEHAKCLIHIYLISQNINPEAIEIRLICNDTLLGTPKELWNATGFENGFDLLSTNPP